MCAETKNGLEPDRPGRLRVLRIRIKGVPSLSVERCGGKLSMYMGREGVHAKM